MSNMAIIDAAEADCISAVEYVGAANYAERERHALRIVRRAFDAVRQTDSAAPDLLAALEALRAIEFGHSEEDICAVRNQADAAIKKARGEA